MSGRERVLLLLLANLLALVTLVQIWPGEPAVPPTESYSIPETSDPIEAVTAVATRHVHGWVDDGLTPDEMSKTAMSRPIYATCGPVSLWADELLSDAGFDTRVNMVLTLDRWNDTDNGHTFIEIREGKRWVAYDIDRKLRWTDAKGRSLSMLEWIERVPSGDYQIVPLLGPVDEAALRRQDRRYAQVPFVRDGGFGWFPSQGSRDEAILGYASDYRVLTPETWSARFYPTARSSVRHWSGTSGSAS